VRTLIVHSLLVSAALLVLPATLHAQALSSPNATAIDGDTLSLTGIKVDLAGIDSVELGQSCDENGEEWFCGERARATLAQFVAGKQVNCTILDRSGESKMTATCLAGRLDLSQAMAEAGFAQATEGAHDNYVEGERKAKSYSLGLWASRFDDPAQWRAAHPAPKPAPKEPPKPAADPAPKAKTAATEPLDPQPVLALPEPLPLEYRDAAGRCAIKGNHSLKGDWIYHLPGQKYYEATNPEALFCTEPEAQAGGYRASRAG